MSEPRQMELYTAMITPMRLDEEGLVPHVDFDAVEEIADYLVENGSDGLVLAGTTGESPALSPDEQIELFRVVARAVGGRAKLIGGTGANTGYEAVELTKRATDLGVLDGILAVSPYYNRPGQYGIKRYFEMVGDATDLPVILYDIPGRTGQEVGIKTITKLAVSNHIAGLKDATGDTSKSRSLRAITGNRLKLHSGDDALNPQFRLDAHADGAISVASHYAGRLMRAQFDAMETGNWARAMQFDAPLRVAYGFESNTEDAEGSKRDIRNPVPTKVMMGIILGEQAQGDFVVPMEPSPEELDFLKERAHQVLDVIKTAEQQLGVE